MQKIPTRNVAITGAATPIKPENEKTHFTRNIYCRHSSHVKNSFTEYILRILSILFNIIYHNRAITYIPNYR